MCASKSTLWSLLSYLRRLKSICVYGQFKWTLYWNKNGSRLLPCLEYIYTHNRAHHHACLHLSLFQSNWGYMPFFQWCWWCINELKAPRKISRLQRKQGQYLFWILGVLERGKKSPVKEYRKVRFKVFANSFIKMPYFCHPENEYIFLIMSQQSAFNVVLSWHCIQTRQLLLIFAVLVSPLPEITFHANALSFIVV